MSNSKLMSMLKALGVKTESGTEVPNMDDPKFNPNTLIEALRAGKADKDQQLAAANGLYNMGHMLQLLPEGVKMALAMGVTIGMLPVSQQEAEQFMKVTGRNVEMPGDDPLMHMKPAGGRTDN